jgi:diguanylate cyclase (GGDEF)-like protein
MTLQINEIETPAVPDEVAQLRASLKQLDRRDWGLWFTAITILLLLCFAVYTLTGPSLGFEDQWLAHDQIIIGVRGLFALVLLFAVFAIHQQYLIKRLRSKLEEQIAVVSSLHARADTFERLAILDPLTGLFNRRFAYEHLPREIARSDRTHQPLIIMMIDLDDFKQINDSFGHAAGDAALVEFARHLKRAIRSADLPVRMGGDEFMLALPDCTIEQADGPLSRIRACQVQHEGHSIDIKFSVGLVQHVIGETLPQLLERADASMYKNKRQAPKSPRDWYADRRGRKGND